MPGDVEFFGSLQSPYCYFALDRLEALARDLDIPIVMRPVLPGVIRIPDAYAGRSPMEQAYFLRDVERTAEFLCLPYGEPEPSPVDWKPGSLWVAEPDQSRAMQLYNMLFQAELAGAAYAVYAAFMRLIWSGRAAGWDSADHLSRVLAQCGLPEGLLDQPRDLIPEAEAYFAANQQAMFACGHWGVPMCVYQNEPFYGQDRLDQLRWRIESAQN